MKPARARVDGQGRILIPAEYRRALGMAEGTPVTLRIQEGVLQVITLAEAIRQIQETAAKYNPDGRSMVQELLDERREEAARE